ncbi:MAG: hypothetical protein U1F98_06580 [Verrucomicrobiota bacterium]
MNVRLFGKRPRRFCAFAVPLILSALLMGCDTPAERLEPEAVATIQPGVTTKKQVLQEFGRPKGTLTGRGRTLLYFERDYQGGRMGMAPTEPVSVVGLSVLFDQNDRVIRTLLSSHNWGVMPARGAPMVGTRVSPEAIAAIQVGKTTRKELIAMIGQPDREALTLGGSVVISWNYWQRVLNRQSIQSLQVYLDDQDVVSQVKTIDVP